MLDAFCRFVDTVNDRVGRAGWWLFIPLVFIVAIEVVSRDFFNYPTIWAWDINLHLGALLILLGGGYNLLHRQHVTVDLVVERLSLRTRALIDLITSPVFFFGYGVLFWLAIGEAQDSFNGRDVHTTLFAELFWPLKAMIVVGAFLLLIQGVVRFIRDLGLVTRSGGEGMS